MVLDLMNELVKQVSAIVWTGTGLWVVLHRKNRLIFKADARNRFVV